MGDRGGKNPKAQNPVNSPSDQMKAVALWTALDIAIGLVKSADAKTTDNCNVEMAVEAEPRCQS
jgi:hypothetical protein